MYKPFYTLYIYRIFHKKRGEYMQSTYVLEDQRVHVLGRIQLLGRQWEDRHRGRQREGDKNG